MILALVSTSLLLALFFLSAFFLLTSLAKFVLFVFLLWTMILPFVLLYKEEVIDYRKDNNNKDKKTNKGFTKAIMEKLK